jgi:hypothetical protein
MLWIALSQSFCHTVQGSKQLSEGADSQSALVFPLLKQQASAEVLHSAKQALVQHHDLALAAASNALADSKRLERESEVLQVGHFVAP